MKLKGQQFSLTQSRKQYYKILHQLLAAVGLPAC